ncbi:MAG: CinA family protein [Collinsella stercoris]|nr:CinA family protein [Collinsella stercoris]
MDAMTLEGRLECAARELVDRARGIGLTLATAESCTAGLVAARIADIPGASDVLRGGAVTYCDAVKRRVLGVSEDTLRLHSAVSDPCAREMAVGARVLFEADMAVSLTGYAGPGGGTLDDPAGTVYIGLADERGATCARCSFEGSRNDVRAHAALFALQMLLKRCDDM